MNRNADISSSRGRFDTKPGRDRWLLSYADFITLLLALFVVLYASARVDVEESQSLFDGLQAAFFFDKSSPAVIPIETLSSELQSTAAATIAAQTQLEKDVAQELESQRLRLGEDLGTSLYQTEQGLVISLASAEFFPAGGVEIPSSRKAVLGAIAPLLGANAMPLRFEGHTDDQPIGSGPFPSNWELSTARAAAVARLFIEDHGIDPRRIATVGYAEFRPIVANQDNASRAQNRRVEIVVLQDAEMVPTAKGRDAASELDQLLEGLPPIPERADESLRPADLGPPPEDIPLP